MAPRTGGPKARPRRTGEDAKGSGGPGRRAGASNGPAVDESSGPEPVFDREKLAALCIVLSEEELGEMLACFPGEALTRLTQIKAAIADDDLDTARGAAHSLKGMATNFGATRLAVAARSVEMEAPTIAAIKERLPGLEAVVDATRDWVSQYRDGAGPPGTAGAGTP